MIALLAVCSLAVDFGRVQVAKAELRRAADAAARAGAAGLPDPTETTRLARTFAQANTADGQAISVVDAQDIEVGTWNAWTRKFTKLIGADLAGADAVRVTLRRTAQRGNAVPLTFGRLIGISSCDVPAFAVARYSWAKGPGVVGIDGVTMKGGDLVNSYDSSKGSYTSQPSGSDVVVGSNQPIYMNGSCVVEGDVYCPPEPALPGDKVTGDKLNFTDQLKYDAATLPAGAYTDHGSVTLNGGAVMTLTAGTHVMNDLRMTGGAVINVTGAAKLYIRGEFRMDGNSRLSASGDRPQNLEIYVVGSGKVDLARNDLYAVLYAPQSQVEMNGNSNFFGLMIARTLDMNGNNTIHFDETLPVPPVGSPRILLVQ